MERRRPETVAVHAAATPEPVTGALVAPVFQATTYAHGSPPHDYGRTINPTRGVLERCVAELEGAAHGVAFASGMAAITTVMQALPVGSRVVCGRDVYGGTHRLLTRVLHDQLRVDFRDLCATPDDIPPGTDLVWLETPTNPLLRIADIAAVAARCDRIGARLAVDNTFATPMFQRPLALGAHVVVHSSTKYLNGHSDVIGGLVCTDDDDLAARLRFLQNAAGAIPGPWDAWLTVRGVRTLAVRMAAHDRNATAVARFLADHPAVEQVWFPGLPTHPGHALATRQMTGFGGVVSFALDSAASAQRFAERVELFTQAESLGGVESVVGLPPSMSHHTVPRDERLAMGIVDGMVRLSVGIEHSDDLIADLDQALR